MVTRIILIYFGPAIAALQMLQPATLRKFASVGTVHTMPLATAQSPDTNAEPTGRSAASNQLGNVEQTKRQEEGLDSASWQPAGTEDSDKRLGKLPKQSRFHETTASNAKEEWMLPLHASDAAPATSPKPDHTVAPAEARTTEGEHALRTCVQNFLSSRSQAPILVCESDVTTSGLSNGDIWFGSMFTSGNGGIITTVIASGKQFHKF